ncbi:MAG: hypothetical protein AB9842_06310 [Bacteroidales bacterium]
MLKKYYSLLFWIFAFLFMATIAIYQRMTGPTYPVRAKISIDGQLIKGKLLTSSDSDGEAQIEITAPDTSISGVYQYRRFKSHDEWTMKPLVRSGDKLVAGLPHQPPAGKVMYTITLNKGGNEFKVNEEPVILRYKGKVPQFILIPHIIFMFLAMVFSTRTGIEAIFRRQQTFILSVWTTIFLALGGLILGPVVQYFAFGAFWTGWPWGHDLTDNKTAVALLTWIIAIIRLRKNNNNIAWAIVASIVLLAIYLIPHSVLGSEIDYTQVSIPK